MTRDSNNNDDEPTVGKDTRDQLASVVERRGFVTIDDLSERAGIRIGRIESAVDLLEDNDRVQSTQLGTHRLVISLQMDRKEAVAKWFDVVEQRCHGDPRLSKRRENWDAYR